MKTFDLIFNNKIYAFDSSMLPTFYDRMVYNEKIDDDCTKCVISFLTNKFLMKTYDDLEYHEFVIDGDFRVSQLLCNLENLFGQDKAREYKLLVSAYLGEDISDTDWFNSLSASTAYTLAKKIFNNNDLEKFKNLLAVMYLYECAKNDYEQTIENADDFYNLEFINGIGVHKYEQDDTINTSLIFSL